LFWHFIGQGESIGPSDNAVACVCISDSISLPRTIGVTDEMIKRNTIPTSNDFFNKDNPNSVIH
jgi:hypothetical protein